MNKKITSVVLIFVVALLALVAGAVSAQQPPSGQPGAGGPQGRGHHHALLDVIAEQTGLTKAEILLQVRDGATLAEVITANDGDVDAVIAAAVEEATTRINQAVADNRITQEQADERLATLQEDITNRLNGEFQPREDRRGGFRQALGGFLDLVVEQTGLTREEIMTQLTEGATLGEILTANDVDLEAFVDEVVTQAETQLNEAVTAGRITEEQAAERLDQLRERLNDFLTNGLPERETEL